MSVVVRHDIFIAGKSVDLFVLSENHALYTDWYNWFNDETLTGNTQHHIFPNTTVKQLHFFEDNIASSSSKLQLGVMDKGGVFFGVISLNDINFRLQRAELSMFIGKKEYQTVLYAVESCALLIRHAFLELNMHRIWGGTMRWELAEFLVRMLNFSHEGTLRQHAYKNGKFVDVYSVGVLRSEFDFHSCYLGV